MIEESIQTNNYERPKRKTDQKELPYSLQKKLKKEQGNEQAYIIL